MKRAMWALLAITLATLVPSRMDAVATAATERQAPVNAEMSDEALDAYIGTLVDAHYRQVIAANR